MFDIIGDIHGFHDELVRLLLKLGYQKGERSWQHPERKALFVGDYIDRGPKIPETLSLVRTMVENDQAIALLGNHELNAILFNEKAKEGGYLRSHSLKNFNQHSETILQFNRLEDGQAIYNDYIEWFKSLPIYFENDQFRAVHATWHQASIKELKAFEHRFASDPNFILNAGNKEHPLYSITENLLKGVEKKLPHGLHFFDKDGHKRHEMRIKWWNNPVGTPIEDYGFGADLSEYKGKMASDFVDENWHYADSKPVFFGHYWLKGTPTLQTNKVCCLDYSIGKKEKLVAYRFNGEESLNEKNFVYIDYKD